MKQGERNHNTAPEPASHDTSLENSRLYRDLLVSLNLASEVSVFVKWKGSGNEFDCMEIVGFFFSQENGVILYN